MADQQPTYLDEQGNPTTVYLDDNGNPVNQPGKLFGNVTSGSSTKEEEETGLSKLSKEAREFLKDHPVFGDILSGKYTSPKTSGKYPLVTGMEANPLLPEMEHKPDEGMLSKAGKIAYNNIVRPLSSGVGLLGSVEPGKGRDPRIGQRLEEIGKQIIEPPIPVQVPQLQLGGMTREPLALPPAPTENLDRLPGWYNSAEGTIKAGPTKLYGGVVEETNQPAIEAQLSDLIPQEIRRTETGRFSRGNNYFGSDSHVINPETGQIEYIPPELPTAGPRPFESNYPKTDKPIIDLTPVPGQNIKYELNRMEKEGKQNFNFIKAAFNSDDLVANGFKEAAIEAQKVAGNRPITFREIIRQAGNTFKTAEASLDLSAPLRQGKGLITHPEFWKNLPTMIKSYGSENFYKTMVQGIKEHPNFELWADKLAFTGEEFGKQEEAFLGNWLEHIKTPGLPKTKLDPLQLYAHQVRASDRAYSAFLTKTRFDIANKLFESVKVAQGSEFDMALATDKIAKLVNTASGRGTLGSAERIADDLNTIFFSPRFQTSRLTMLTNPKFYISQPTGIRLEGLRAAAGIAATWGTELALLKAAGADVNFDSTSSDFLKARFGKTRVDLGAGFQQYIVAFERARQGKSTSASGNVTEFNKGYRAPSRMSILFSSDAQGRGLVENKLSPIGTLVDTMIKQKTPDGKEVSVPKEVADRFKSLFTADMIEMVKENPNLWPLGLLGLFGEGIATYGK